MWWKYFSLGKLPLYVGIASAIAWFILHHYTQVDRQDGNVFESVFSVVGIAHSLIASMQISQGYNQQQRIQVALFLKDAQMFRENACIRLSPAVMCLLFMFSLVFFVLLLCYPFVTVKAGLIAVWATVFSLYLLWQFANELYDPFHGIWKVTREEVEESLGSEVADEFFPLSFQAEVI